MNESKFYNFFQGRIKKNRSRLLFQKRDGWSWKQITWLDFNTDVNSIAAFLLDSGFQKEDKVLIVSSNTLERLFVESAILLLGGCTVSIPCDVQVEETAKVLNREKIRFAFAGSADILSTLKPTLRSGEFIEKIFLLSDHRLDIKDNIINYSSVVKFGSMKLKKLKDDLTKLSVSVSPDTPAISLYFFEDGKMESKVLTQEFVLKLLRLSYKKLRFITPEDQSFSYLSSSGLFSELANFLPFFMENRVAIAGSKEDFYTDVLEIMPTVLFLSDEYSKQTLSSFNEENGSGSLRKFFGGRLKYVFTNREPEYSVKNRFIKEGISVIALSELASL